MKIPQSVRVIFQVLEPKYKTLKEAVDKVLSNAKKPSWHYESRVKAEQSFALKLETGRVPDPQNPEDLFACTIVVENRSRVAEAEELVLKLFELHQRRPKDAKATHLAPYSFDFDDLRLYVKWKDDPKLPPTGLAGVVFEVQIKTYLQHAWGIATHDFIYKADTVEWATSRIAYQVKAMLENAELSIGEAKKLTGSEMLDKSDRSCDSLRTVIAAIQSRWETIHLPTDLRRLADNFLGLAKTLRISMDDIWNDLDEATAAGEGVNTLNLSPYGAVLSAVLKKRGAGALEPLNHPKCRDNLFAPLEIDVPNIGGAGQNRIIRPPAPV